MAVMASRVFERYVTARTGEAVEASYATVLSGQDWRGSYGESGLGGVRQVMVFRGKAWQSRQVAFWKGVVRSVKLRYGTHGNGDERRIYGSI